MSSEVSGGGEIFFLGVKSEQVACITGLFLGDD